VFALNLGIPGVHICIAEMKIIKFWRRALNCYRYCYHYWQCCGSEFDYHPEVDPAADPDPDFYLMRMGMDPAFRPDAGSNP